MHARRGRHLVAPGARGDTVTVLGTHVVLGLVGAVAWWLLADPAYFTVGEQGAVGMGELELGGRFETTGWFTVIAVVLGVPAGAALTWWRSRDPLMTAGLLVLGSALATAVMAQVGRLLGPVDPRAAAAAADVGERVPTDLVVGAPVGYLVWTIAALAGALMVLWSPSADARL